ncbi:hypothetical protein OKW41_005581 [Paraburkholderia sp. UCT70]
MTQHRDALARCKATIELAGQMIDEHETRYRAALAALNDEALATLTRRAANHIARVAGNRLVGATAVAVRRCTGRNLPWRFSSTKSRSMRVSVQPQALSQ